MLIPMILVYRLAVTQIVMGSLCIILEVVLIILYYTTFENYINGIFAPGIWNGIFVSLRQLKHTFNW
jgi:hypothetical protein